MVWIPRETAVIIVRVRAGLRGNKPVRQTAFGILDRCKQPVNRELKIAVEDLLKMDNVRISSAIEDFLPQHRIIPGKAGGKKQRDDI